MKKYSILILILCFTVSVNAQDFSKDIADAKSSYSAGKLADAHFSLEQAIQEIDMIVGKEVLKLLPAKMNDQAAVEKDDQVTANVGFVGATVHRSYGDTTGSQVEIISNSPLIASLNSFLNMPLVGGMMRNSTTKVVKIQGYKSRLEKLGDNNGKPNYQLQIPFKSALITITANGMDENAVMSFANSIPLDKIAALIQ